MERKQKNLIKKRLRVLRGVRRRLHGVAEKPRLSVYRSNKQMYCQAIDDESGKTLASVSSITEENRSALSEKNKTEKAKAVGLQMANRLKELGIERAVFDRGWYRYHGIVKAFADAIREGGIKF
ncbi:MAG: 50S ribosomal protein L18 [Planctomycetota bacterium]|jgi:large subunit ribosomal protein L18